MTDVEKSYPSEMRSRLIYLAAELRLRGGVYALWAEDVDRAVKWSDAMRSDLPALKRLSDAAPSGPWEAEATMHGDAYVTQTGRKAFGAVTIAEGMSVNVCPAPADYGKAASEFIAAAANYVRSVLDADDEANKKDLP